MSKFDLNRRSNLAKLRNASLDVLVVGAGINGAASAAALSAKGLRVALLDKGDFAGETSSQSSNLIWGGIKYLENYEFSLVNHLCKSRNLLLDSYPSTVKEIRFLTTIQKGFRYPAQMVYMGTWLYWLMGRMRTQTPKYYGPAAIERAAPIVDTSNAQGGFEYSDCYLFDNDARFVFNLVKKASSNAALVANYVEVKELRQDGQLWVAKCIDSETQTSFRLTAKCVVNACGPWVDQFNGASRQQSNYHHVFSKGVHLLVPRLNISGKDSENKILAFFAADGRLFFVMPMGPVTCIGTTDTPVEDAEVKVTDEDRSFILDNVNQLLDLQTPLSNKDILAERCGVRPLVAEGQQNGSDWLQMSRKHELNLDAKQKYMSVYGGKLTDCINVGEEVCDAVEKCLENFANEEVCWYGEDPQEQKHRFLRLAAEANIDTHFAIASHETLSDRLWRRYGEDAFVLLDKLLESTTSSEIVIPSTQYRRCELEYIAENEMVVKLSDFLRRRSKIALVVPKFEYCNEVALADASRILFGDKAEQKTQEFLLDN